MAADPEAPAATWTHHPRLLGLRRRSRTATVLLDTVDGYSTHRTGRNAALLAHHAFLSVFPLVLVLTTVLGYVLESNPDLQADIVDSALAQLPIIGQQIADDPARLTGNLVVLVLGLATTLWAGMRAFVGVQTALDDIAEIPPARRPNIAVTRGRALLGIVVVGVAQIVTATLTSLVGIAGIAVLSKILLGLAAVAINAAVLAAMFRWLCSSRPAWREVRSGALVGGVIFAALQLFGTTVVQRAIANASPVYGTFATVIGLITWLSLHAAIALICGELNRTLQLRRLGAEPTPIRAV